MKKPSRGKRASNCNKCVLALKRYQIYVDEVSVILCCQHDKIITPSIPIAQNNDRVDTLSNLRCIFVIYSGKGRVTRLNRVIQRLSRLLFKANQKIAQLEAELARLRCSEEIEQRLLPAPRSEVVGLLPPPR
ncbi:MAG: hypothetical protein AAGF94_09110 [Pseudomonadota bacterium]